MRRLNPRYGSLFGRDELVTRVVYEGVRYIRWGGLYRRWYQLDPYHRIVGDEARALDEGWEAMHESG